MDPIRDALPREQLGKGRVIVTPQEFLEQETTTDRGGAWSAAGHKPFVAILDEFHSVINKRIPNKKFALLKAEQIGATHTIGLGIALYLAAVAGVNVGYFLPDKTLAERIAKTRLKNLIRRSLKLNETLRDHTATNQALIKEFDGWFLYMFGLGELTDAISTPLDARGYDEVDLIPEENLEWSKGRTTHSDFNLEWALSAGYNPGAGISLLFEDGTQDVWRVDCAHCKRRGICLEEAFLETEGAIIQEVAGKYRFVCDGCGKPLDVDGKGRFVSTEPKAERRSWRVSQCAISAIDPAQILSDYRESRKKKSKLAKFKVRRLAIPDAGALQPFDATMLTRMQSGEVKRLTRSSIGTLPRYCGLDLGDTCHFLAYERLPNGNPHLVLLAELDVDTAEKDAWALYCAIGGVSMVSDKKPHTNVARGLAYRSPRSVRLIDFVDNAPLNELEEEHDRKKYLCLKVDRTDAIDEMCDEFTDERHFLRIPDLESDEVLETFAKQVKNLKKEEFRDKDGRVRYRYKRAVENHFGFSLVYARLAERYAPPSSKFEYFDIDMFEPDFDGDAIGWRERLKK